MMGTRNLTLMLISLNNHLHFVPYRVDDEYIPLNATLYAQFDVEYEHVPYTTPDHAFQDRLSNAFEIDRTVGKKEHVCHIKKVFK